MTSMQTLAAVGSQTQIWPSVAAQAAQISMIPGGSRAYRHQHGFRWKHRPSPTLPHRPCWQPGPWVSTPTSAVAGHWTQMWPLVAARTKTSLCSQVAVQASHINMAPNGSLANGFKIVLGCSPDHCHLLGPLWKCVPQRGDYTHGLSRQAQNSTVRNRKEFHCLSSRKQSPYVAVRDSTTTL